MKYIAIPIILLIPLIASAQVVRIENPLSVDSIEELIENIVNFLFNISLYIAPIMILYAGFMFITAAGDPAKISTAKKLIFWVLVGLVIIFSAKGIIKILQSIFIE